MGAEGRAGDVCCSSLLPRVVVGVVVAAGVAADATAAAKPVGPWMKTLLLLLLLPQLLRWE